MDYLGYVLNTVYDLYNAATRRAVYTFTEKYELRKAEIMFNMFGGRSIDGLKINYDKISDALGLYDEIFCYKCYDFVTDNEAPYIIDGGGNIGFAMLRFMRLYPKAEIVVFEPQPDVYRLLQKNIVNNNHGSKVRAVNAALSSEDGEASFNRLVGGKTDCCASLIEVPGMNDKIMVKTLTLLPYVNRRVDLLKLDIEGVEYDVVKRVADAGLLRNVERIILEYHPARRGDVKNGYLAPLLKLLDDNGYYIDIRVPHEVSGEYQRFSWNDGFSYFIVYAAKNANDISSMGAYAHYKREMLN